MILCVHFQVKFAIQYMRRAVQKKAKFDIMELNTIKVSHLNDHFNLLSHYLTTIFSNNLLLILF